MFFNISLSCYFLVSFFKSEAECSISRELKPASSELEVQLHCPSPSRALKCPEMCSYLAGKVVHKNHEQLLLSPLLLSSEPSPQTSHKIIFSANRIHLNKKKNPAKQCDLPQLLSQNLIFLLHFLHWSVRARLTPPLNLYF